MVRKRPRMHDNVLGLARGPYLENAMASPLISPTVVNRWLVWRPDRRMKPSNWAGVFCLSFAVETAAIIRPPNDSSNLIGILRLWSAARPLKETANLVSYAQRFIFCGSDRRPDHRLKPPNGAFQANFSKTMSFHFGLLYIHSLLPLAV